MVRLARYCYIEVSDHWNMKLSVLEALKNFCHWMYRWAPFCPNATPTLPGGAGAVKSKITQQPHLGRPGPGDKGRLCGRGVGGGQPGSSWCLKKGHQSGPHCVMSLVSSRFWSGLDAWQTREKNTKNPSCPKMKAPAVLAQYPALPQQTTQNFEANTFQLPFFHLYLYLKHWGGPQPLMQPTLTPDHTQQCRFVSVEMTVKETTSPMKRFII